MEPTAETVPLEPGARELKKLRGELWILVPFFLYSLYVFVGSFGYKFQAATVPMVIGLSTAILTALRLFHVAFPKSRVGRFREAGLAGEFDHLKEEIEEETLKGKYEEPPSRRITGRDEGKAFLALLFSCAAFVLFGYVVGSLLAVLGTTRCYGYKRPLPIVASCVGMFLLLYVILHRLFGAEIMWGLVLHPILESLDLL